MSIVPSAIFRNVFNPNEFTQYQIGRPLMITIIVIILLFKYFADTERLRLLVKPGILNAITIHRDSQRSEKKKKNIWYDVMIPTTHRHLYLSLCHQISFRLLHALQSKYTLHKGIKAIARRIRTKGKVERFGTFIIVYRKSKCFQVTDFPEINARDKYTIALRLRLLLYISSAHALIHVRVYIHISIYIYFPFSVLSKALSSLIPITSK